MKLQVLIRSASWLASAGTRIRYQRLMRELDAWGWRMAIDPIGSISEGLALNADIYIISKCHDAGALMIADMLREAGAIVGFDLFDDYVSGNGSLTFGHREFLRQMTDKIDFLLCSTERMAEVIRAFGPAVPVHVMNDPHGGFDAARLGAAIAAKRAQTEASRTIEMVWFGQGNNPIFPVGLSDAITFGSELEVLGRDGWTVKLKVISNPDALEEAVMGALQSLPFEVTIEPWSQEREAAALERALVAFLPVNFQNFSIAKSLNRAVSALTRGVQVLGTGFGLYDPLAPLVYCSAAELAEDLRHGRLLLDEGRLGTLAERLASIADPAREAGALVAFLEGITPLAVTPVEGRAMRAIVHGSISTGQIHRLCTALGWLSLGSPLTRLQLPFHAEIAQFEPDGGIEIRVSREGHSRLDEAFRQRAQKLPRSRTGGHTYRVPLPESAAGRRLAVASEQLWRTRAARIMTGHDLMEATVAVYREIYPDTRLLVAEMETPQFASALDVKGRP